MKDLKRQAKSLIGEPEEEDETKLECPSLTWKQRIIGFSIMLSIGLILSVIAAFMAPSILNGHPERFAIPYAFAAICSLLSTVFLMGPVKQIKKMFDKDRWIATTIYILSIIGTLVAAFVSGNAGIVLLCIIIQICALAWYALTYIPYGRQMLAKCCQSAVST